MEGKVDRKTQTSDDTDAYDLIMRDKERLLSLDEPVRFIFSHSALREGWDNPNVFQICARRTPTTTMCKPKWTSRNCTTANLPSCGSASTAKPFTRFPLTRRS